MQVDLHDCEIGASGARSFAAAFEDARDALEAEASGGVASDAEINGRAAGPARKIRLQVLRLDGNPLGFSGTSALKPLLSQLKELHLGRAALGDEGGSSEGSLLLAHLKVPCNSPSCAEPIKLHGPGYPA